jgi:ParB family transcriptional regulator, chromosome partitioning protein
MADSLAENDERVCLHPLDQFRAFKLLRDGGMSEEDIAARHFVSPAIVKQRLRLASVSPKLHDVYADDGMTLEQLMALSVTADQARQEQVWDNVSRSGYDEPYQIPADVDGEHRARFRSSGPVRRTRCLRAGRRHRPTGFVRTRRWRLVAGCAAARSSRHRKAEGRG